MLQLILLLVMNLAILTQARKVGVPVQLDTFSQPSTFADADAPSNAATPPTAVKGPPVNVQAVYHNGQ